MLFPPFNRNRIIQHLADYIGYRQYGFPIVEYTHYRPIQSDSTDWIREIFLGVTDKYHLHHYHPIGVYYAPQQIHNSRSIYFKTKTNDTPGLTKEIKTTRITYG